MKTANSTARLLIVERIYQQLPGKQPVCVSGQFCRHLSTTEQSYVRQSSVGEDWEPVDRGWLKSVSFLMLTNEEGKRLQRIPTPAQAQLLQTRVIELALKNPHTYPDQGLLLFPPGESHRITPSPDCDLYIRCREGKASYTLILLP